MVRKGKMPPSAHDFALRDVAFCNGERFALARSEPGRSSCAYVFFPGCQLAGSAPEHVEKAYAYLREGLSGGVGLWLRCCGAPAHWAGEGGLFRQGLDQIRGQWEELGRPRIITACSSCWAVLREELPEADLVSLWEVYDQAGLPRSAPAAEGYRVAVHDACTTRHEGRIQAGVRRVLGRLGCRVEELPYGGERTGCCGFGGLMAAANPPLADRVTARRAGESDADYVAYCAMCRDRLAAQGKRAVHLLDLIHPGGDGDPAARPDPGWSQRHENRARLKKKLLEEVWGETAVDDAADVRLVIDPEQKEAMERQMILVEDVQKVVEAAERTGNKLVNREGRHLAHLRPVSVTYWVEYAPVDGGFRVYNTYAHRMQIAGEVQ